MLFTKEAICNYYCDPSWIIFNPIGLRDKASDIELRIQKSQRMEEDLKLDGEALYFD